MHVELSQGQSAELVDPDDVTSGVRKAIFRASTGPDKVEQVDVPDAVIAHLITSWTLDLPLPKGKNRVSLDHLRIRDYDALQGAAMAVLKEITPSFEPDPDRSSPTQPSGD